MDATQRTTALMDGPAPLRFERVVEGMPLRGVRVRILDETTGKWYRDLRAVDDPYWMDRETLDAYLKRWPGGADPPKGAAVYRAELTVSVVTEPDWWEWARTKRRPKVEEYPAYRVRAEAED